MSERRHLTLLSTELTKKLRQIRQQAVHDRDSDSAKADVHLVRPTNGPLDAHLERSKS